MRQESYLPSSTLIRRSAYIVGVLFVLENMRLALQGQTYRLKTRRDQPNQHTDLIFYQYSVLHYLLGQLFERTAILPWGDRPPRFPIVTHEDASQALDTSPNTTKKRISATDWQAQHVLSTNNRHPHNCATDSNTQADKTKVEDRNKRERKREEETKARRECDLMRETALFLFGNGSVSGLSTSPSLLASTPAGTTTRPDSRATTIAGENSWWERR